MSSHDNDDVEAAGTTTVTGVVSKSAQQATTPSRFVLCCVYVVGELSVVSFVVCMCSSEVIVTELDEECAVITTLLGLYCCL